jgi:tetratricopeptide (TPR) repeat protein
LAARAYRAGRVEEAWRLLASPEDGVPEAAWFVNRGRVRLALGQAREALGEVAAIAAESPDPLARAAALAVAGACRRWLDEPAASLADLEEALRLARQLRDAPRALEALQHLARLRLDASDGKAAVISAGEALGVTEVTRDDAEAAICLALLSRGHRAWGYARKAGELAAKAAGQARKVALPLPLFEAAIALPSPEPDGWATGAREAGILSAARATGHQTAVAEALALAVRAGESNLREEAERVAAGLPLLRRWLLTGR